MAGVTVLFMVNYNCALTQTPRYRPLQPERGVDLAFLLNWMPQVPQRTSTQFAVVGVWQDFLKRQNGTFENIVTLSAQHNLPGYVLYLQDTYQVEQCVALVVPSVHQCLLSCE